jgi:hypothetical protein
MKTYIINTFVFKKGACSRSNFNIKTDKTSESDIKTLILEKLNIKKEWEMESDKFELIQSENVIRYTLNLKRSEIVDTADSK